MAGFCSILLKFKVCRQYFSIMGFRYDEIVEAILNYGAYDAPRRDGKVNRSSVLG